MKSQITDPKTEALVILAEECCEVGQAISKIHRWGLAGTNLDDLTKEIGDLLAIIPIVQQQFQISNDDLEIAISQKLDKLKVFSNLLG